MGTKQIKDFEQTNHMLEDASIAIIQYWRTYSNLNTWQFWFLLGALIVPLIILYFLIDKKRALLIGFFGFNIHVWFHYFDLFTTTHGLTNYPYKAIPFLPVSILLDSTLIPVAFMLLYQWTTQHNKNYYLYATSLSAFIAFLFKPALVTFDLFRIYKGMNYFYIFLMILFVSFLSKWMTNLFLQFQKQDGDSRRPLVKTYKLNRLFPRREKAK